MAAPVVRERAALTASCCLVFLVMTYLQPGLGFRSAFSSYRWRSRGAEAKPRRASCGPSPLNGRRSRSTRQRLGLRQGHVEQIFADADGRVEVAKVEGAWTGSFARPGRTIS